MTVSKQHFEAIAAAVRKADLEMLIRNIVKQWDEYDGDDVDAFYDTAADTIRLVVASHLADALIPFNPRFEAGRFIRAAKAGE